MPPDVVHGRHVYFAVGNIDFAEDIPDSKHTLHATAMAIYQQCKPTDVTRVVEVKGVAKDHSLSDPSVITTELLP